jgi:hypothetical protein
MVLGHFGSYSDKICVYSKNKTAPAWLFPYSITIFPQNDQDMLSIGIPYHNKEEFNRLMEDFLS